MVEMDAASFPLIPRKNW